MAAGDGSEATIHQLMEFVKKNRVEQVILPGNHEKVAKELGMTVIITDHHDIQKIIRSDRLRCADSAYSLIPCDITDPFHIIFCASKPGITGLCIK